MKYKIEMQPLAGRTVVACKDPQTGVVLRALRVPPRCSGCAWRAWKCRISPISSQNATVSIRLG